MPSNATDRPVDAGDRFRLELVKAELEEAVRDRIEARRFLLHAQLDALARRRGQDPRREVHREG
jgi:hypothetical protein